MSALPSAIAVPSHPVVLRPATSASAWDALVSTLGGNFFHRQLFLSTVAGGLGLELDLHIVTADGEPIGVAPLLLKRLGPLSTVNWVPFPYLGPLVPDDMLTPTLVALARHERRIRCVRSQHVLTCLHPVANPPGAGSADDRLTKIAGYDVSVDRTFVVPLAGRSDAELLSGMSSRRRASVRRAERAGLVVRAATQREVTDVMPSLSRPIFERQGLPDPYPAEFLGPVWERLAQEPSVLLQAAEIDGRIVAVQISLAHGGTGLGWIVGRQIDQSGSDAYAAMVWHTLCWARDRGCADFDLVGAPTEGIANYKRGLGGEERRYTVLRRQARTHRAALTLLNRLPGRRHT